MLVYIRSIGRDGLAMILPVEGPVDPGYGGGIGSPDHPWFGGRPDRPNQGLPGAGHIDNSLPGGAGHPDHRPPSGPPVQVGPGEVLVLVRDQAGVWHYAALPSGSPPPRPVPVPPPATGPGSPPVAGMPLPGGPPVHGSGQPVPPTATPQR